MNSRELHAHVQDRFQEVFGQPHHVLAQAAQWTLGSSTAGPPINILLNGANEQTSVWVFDPLAADQTSPVTAIVRSEEVDGVIANILHVVNRRPMQRQEPDFASLLQHPTRISGFVRGVHGWSDCMAISAVDASRLETEKVRIFGRFLVEDDAFADAYLRNRDALLTSISSEQALTSTCSFFNAVADLVKAGPTR